jgi:TPR repeat protein
MIGRVQFLRSGAMKNLLAVALVAIVALVLIGSPQVLERVRTKDPAALNQQGLASYFGNGVPKDLNKAREFFLQAAEQNYTPAQVNLGMMYDHGDGVQKDYRVAMQWYQRAADLGDRDGRQMLGTMYFYGLGVEVDRQKAMYYFIAATAPISESNKSVAVEMPKPRLVEVAAR